MKKKNIIRRRSILMLTINILGIRVLHNRLYIISIKFLFPKIGRFDAHASLCARAKALSPTGFEIKKWLARTRRPARLPPYKDIEKCETSIKISEEQKLRRDPEEGRAISGRQYHFTGASVCPRFYARERGQRRRGYDLRGPYDPAIFREVATASRATKGILYIC